MRRPMSKVLPGLYIGSILDAQDVFEQDMNRVTHVVSLRSSPKRVLKLYHYLHVPIADAEDQNIAKYFSLCNDFIQRARLQDKNNNVLVHCYAGISRSATIVIAYMMTVVNLGWDLAWRVLETVRPGVRPNLCFQDQLRRYQIFGLKAEQRRLFEKYPTRKLEAWDRFRIEALLNDYVKNSVSFHKDVGQDWDEEDDEEYFYDCHTADDVDNDRDSRLSLVHW